MCGTISRVGDEDGDVYGECTNTRRDDKGDGESRRKDDVARILSAARNGEMIERSFSHASHVPPALVARSDSGMMATFFHRIHMMWYMDNSLLCVGFGVSNFTFVSLRRPLMNTTALNPLYSSSTIAWNLPSQIAEATTYKVSNPNHDPSYEALLSTHRI
jgi:hypothetical protein